MFTSLKNLLYPLLNNNKKVSISIHIIIAIKIIIILLLYRFHLSAQNLKLSIQVQSLKSEPSGELFKIVIKLCRRGTREHEGILGSTYTKREERKTETFFIFCETYDQVPLGAWPGGNRRSCFIEGPYGCCQLIVCPFTRLAVFSCFALHLFNLKGLALERLFSDSLSLSLSG